MKRRETIFISDLHLTGARESTVSRFLHFLTHRAIESERLCILGDLFDTYLGDDDRSHPYDSVRRQLSALSQSGTEIYFQPGNRDFLLGEAFAQATGVILLDDRAVMDLYGTPTLLMHGDLLCTDDVNYLAARARIRTPEWRAYALGKPLWVRRLYARWYRFKSGKDKGGKSMEIMDANEAAILSTMMELKVTRLIHGHTHRPAHHTFSHDGLALERVVLPEWNGNEWLVTADSNGIQQQPL